MERVRDNVFGYSTRKGARFMARVEHLGQTIRKKGFTTPELAEEWVTTFRAQLVTQKYFPDRVDAPPLKDLAPTWLKGCERKNLRHNTLRSYRANLTTHILPLLGAVPVNRITRRHIADFIATKKDERPEKPYSRDAIRLMLAPLSVLLSDYMDEGRFGIEANPCLRPGRLIKIKVRKKQLKAYSRAEEGLILKACKEKRPDQYGLLCSLFWGGLRPGEAWALQLPDLDLRKKQLHVSKTFTDGQLHDTPKNGQTRIVEIDGRLAKVLGSLTKMGQHRSKLVFPGKDGHRHHSQWNRRIWTPIVTAAGVPRYPPYATRHTYATRQLERGCSLQWLMHQMGHSSIKITVDTYGHLARAKS